MRVITYLAYGSRFFARQACKDVKQQRPLELALSLTDCDIRPFGGGAFGYMSYAVKEIFLTLQGEGGQAGRAAVFCRFAGCNLWSGREIDRASAVCTFCDTDFVGMDGEGGGRFETPEALVQAVAAKWKG